MLPSPASSLSFPSPSSAARLIHMPAATGSGLRATSRTSRRRSVLNLSRPAHSSRRSAGVAIPRACFTPLGRGSGESRSGWRSGWRRWSTISTWTVPLSRRGQRWERRAAKPRRAFAAAAANLRFSPQARGAVAAGNPFRRQGRGAGGVGAPLPALRNARRRQRRALRWVTLSPWRSAVTLRQCTRASRIMKLTRVGETPSSLAMSFCGTPCRRYISKA